MNEIILKGRNIQKHDIEANWIKAGEAENPFIPKQGEIIVYDDRIISEGADGEKIVEIVADKVRYKIGNGIDNILLLPFVEKNTYLVLSDDGQGNVSIDIANEEV